MVGKFELRTFGHLQRQSDNYLTAIVGKIHNPNTLKLVETRVLYHIVPQQLYK